MKALGTAARRATIQLNVIVALSICGCGLNTDEPPAPAATPAPAIQEATRTARQGLDAIACVPTDAHGRHAVQGYDCTVCHECGGNYAFSSITFPGGTSTAGGTISRGAPAATCTVACHSPLGAQPHSVAWNTVGPLPCASCHNNVAALPAGSVRSSHLASIGTDSSACQSCHDQSQHTSGQVLIVNATGGSSVASCTACHSGQGQTLLGDTPPLLVGWSDTVSGDFHGARAGTCRFDRLDTAGQRSIGTGALSCPTAQPDSPNALRLTPRWWYKSGTSGPFAWACDLETVDTNGNRIGTKLTGQPCPSGTILNSTCGNPQYPERCYPTTLVVRGFGGTLLPPYVNDRTPLACKACHDPHASSNPFLLAAQVNGVPILADAIDRAGVGAQALCNACHAGSRHELCTTCHGVDPKPDGSACFYCHGHEGILHMQASSPAYPDPSTGHPEGLAWQSKSQPECTHCHALWAPPPTEYVAPALTVPPAVTGLSGTTATIWWQTAYDRSTSYVEYGEGTAGYVAGDNNLTTQHSVTLTGLKPSTSYVWRIRSSDQFRNVVQTGLQTFVTASSATAVPPPALGTVYGEVAWGTRTANIPLLWYRVTAPSGTAVQYEVQLASDPGFTSLVDASISGPGIPGSTVGDSGWITGTLTTYNGRPAATLSATFTNIFQDDCENGATDYYWRVRARDQNGNVSAWSAGTFGVIAAADWCY